MGSRPGESRDPLPKLLDETAAIIPIGIFFLDQLDLPIAFPGLKLLFARDRLQRSREHFHVHEAENSMLLHELRASPSAMLLDASANIVGNADVERPVMAAGEDVVVREER